MQKGVLSLLTVDIMIAGCVACVKFIATMTSMLTDLMYNVKKRQKIQSLQPPTLHYFPHYISLARYRQFGSLALQRYNGKYCRDFETHSLLYFVAKIIAILTTKAPP